MTPEPLLGARKRIIYLSLALAGFAAACGGFFGLALERRIQGPLDKAMSAVSKIRQGDYNISFSKISRGELGELQKAIFEMAQGLSIKQHELESKVQQRTAELQEAVEEKGRLIARSNALLEQERRRIAVDIHDQLNSSLVAVRFAASALTADEDKPLTQQEVNQIAGEISKTTEDLYKNARRIIKSLRPEVIDTLGFRGAVEELVRQFSGIQHDCKFKLYFEDDVPHLSSDTSITAYRVVQEALNNIAKHAAASSVEIHVSRVNDHRIRLLIRDDGIGFNTRKKSSGVGLIGMRERVLSYHGSFSLNSEDRGTDLSVELETTGLQTKS